jgi:hypothetical protein
MTLETLGEIWAPRASHHLARFPESLTADETTELRATVVEFLGEVVRSHEFREARMAIMIAGRMGLVTLLPEIEHRVMNAGHDVDSPVIWGISQFPAELSVPLLLKLSDRKGVDIVEVLSTLVRLGDRSCTGRIVSLLDDTTETDRNSCRVCDWAAITLKQIYPEGPQPNHYPSDRVDADRVIREWKDYLSGLEIEESGEGG